jgi:hypothetical protein
VTVYGDNDVLSVVEGAHVMTWLVGLRVNVTEADDVDAAYVLVEPAETKNVHVPAEV